MVMTFVREWAGTQFQSVYERLLEMMMQNAEKATMMMSVMMTVMIAMAMMRTVMIAMAMRTMVVREYRNPRDDSLVIRDIPSHEQPFIHCTLHTTQNSILHPKLYSANYRAMHISKLKILGNQFCHAVCIIIQYKDTQCVFYEVCAM